MCSGRAGPSGAERSRAEPSGAAGGFPASPIATVNMETDFLGPIVIAEYLTWERARGFKTGRV